MEALINKRWWEAALIRAIKTMAQVAVGFITVGAAINEINWPYMASVTAVSGVYSLLTSVAGLPEVKLASAMELSEVKEEEEEG